MNTVEIISLIASIVSVLIGAAAVWLSFQFFRMSQNSTEKINDVSKEISSSITTLKKLFDVMYANVFSIVKDTNTDMRKKILWPEDRSDVLPKSNDSKLSEHQGKEMEEKIKTALKKQKDITDTKLKEISEIIRKTYIETIRNNSKHRPEVIRQKIERQLSSSKDGSGMAAAEIVKPLRSDFETRDILRELRNMRDHGDIFWVGDTLDPGTEIFVAPQ